MVMNAKEEKNKIFFHIDVNSAFLSWSAVRRLQDGEELDIRTIPAIIGGDESMRHGIVLAKSIPCKAYGIQTAEPIAMALRKCPMLKVYPSEFETYRTFSRKMMNYIRSYCPDIMQVSIDECYMDFTPISYKYEDPVICAREIKDGIKENFGFTVNIGISNKKVLAKMASDFTKPDKIHTLYDYEIKSKMWPLPIGDLYMCGKSSQRELYKLGIRTIGDLANAKRDIIELNLKSIGLILHDFANGIDDSELALVRDKEKSISHAHTIDHDVTAFEEARKILLGLSDEIGSKLRKSGFKAINVAVEIKYSDFKNVSKQRMLNTYTDNSDEIFETVIALFELIWNQDPIRLLGIRVSHLADEETPVQMSIFDFSSINEQNNKADDIIVPDKEKRDSLSKAIDEIRNKYGKDSIKRLSE